MDIKRVGPQTYQVQLRLPGAAWITTVYLITGERAAIIEPGPAAAIPSVREAMESLGIGELAYVMPTHIHLDHAGAMGELARNFPKAKVVLHPSAVKHAVEPTKLISGYRQAFGENFESVYGAFNAVPESQVISARNGDTIHLGGRVIEVIYAPGHAYHHMAFFDRDSGVLFCGEALGVPFPGAEQSPLPAAAPPAFDLEMYLKTARELEKLHPRILLYSHYGPGLNPEELIQRTIENTAIFGEMVLSGLRAGNKSDDIAGRILEHFNHHRGVTLDRVDQLIMDGFIHYFRKNRLA